MQSPHFQAISTKMLHDASPAGPRRITSLPHAVRLIYAEHVRRREPNLAPASARWVQSLDAHRGSIFTYCPPLPPCGNVLGYVDMHVISYPQVLWGRRFVFPVCPQGLWRGFFCGLEPALIKGASTNCIRFPVFGIFS